MAGFRNILASLLITAAVVGVTDAALAAMSIDWGSQSLKIGLVKPGVPMEIVLNKDSRRKTPFIIGIKNGERYFGDAAVQLGLKHPANTFDSFLDLAGKKIDNPIVQKYQETHPHLTLVADEKRGTVVFQTEEGLFPVETLLAMMLWNARDQCEAYAGQPVKDTVITVPVYFHQSERKAIQDAAEIAGLNLLQLLADSSASGLNYGVFRRKSIGEQAQTLLIYDIGFAKTTASIVEFRLAKEKNSKEQNPVISTLGVGYDRTLGGNELTLRLRDYLIQQFVKNSKPKGDIRGNPRAMAKLLKESERVKQVLSANVDHIAQIESLFEDKDFRLKITRDEFLQLITDLEARFIQPVKDALKMSELKAEQVDQVVLMGAGTRVPRLQQLLQDTFKGKELGRFLNTDEAAAMGAVYQAAHLSKGFKVKKFDVQELQLFPVQVQFTSGSVTEENKEPSIINRILYGYKSYFPAAKKVISFTSHTDDFDFNLNYGSLAHLTPEQLEHVGSHNITNVAVKGVSDTLKTELTDESAAFKGVKVHFYLDQVGVIKADHAELIVERMEPASNSTLSKIVGKIGEFFSDSGKADPGKIEDEQANANDDEKKPEGSDDEFASDTVEPSQNSTETGSDAQSNDDKAKQEDTEKKQSDENKDGNEPAKDEKKPSEKEEEKKTPAKPKISKIPLTMENTGVFYAMNAEEIKDASKILSDYEKKEKEKAARDAAQNSLEATVYDLASKIEEDSFKRFATSDEISALESNLTTLKAWLEDDVTHETTKDEFLTKKKDLDALVKKLKFRKRQNEERDKYVAQLEKALSDSAIESFKSLSTIFTEVELKTLEKTISDTKQWLADKKEQQSKLADNQDPAFTVAELKEKTGTVEREVKYLLNKMYAAKLKAEQEKAKEEAKAKEAAEKAKAKEAKEKISKANETDEKKTDEAEGKEEKEVKVEEVKVDETGEADKNKQTAEEEEEKKPEEANTAPTHDADEL